MNADTRRWPERLLAAIERWMARPGRFEELLRQVGAWGACAEDGSPNPYG